MPLHFGPKRLGLGCWIYLANFNRFIFSGQWDSMEEYICLINRNTLDGAFYRCVLAVHQEHYQLAQQCADKARDLIDTELTAL